VSCCDVHSDTCIDLASLVQTYDALFASFNSDTRADSCLPPRVVWRT
jgi:hypothetical protein